MNLWCPTYLLILVSLSLSIYLDLCLSVCLSLFSLSSNKKVRAPPEPLVPNNRVNSICPTYLPILVWTLENFRVLPVN